MSTPAIIIEGLSKSYRIQHQERYPTLRDALVRTATAPLRRLRQLSGRANDNADGEETFWALKDVSFEVQSGEVVGIIGRNGAGKSTLLKILSRITEPTSGRAVLNGRVASLLEVGTGFHPELTGRENIYLNGAILGMKRAEISRKFDEIVAFAEIEKFLDTPVKRYSSGMYVRLAFAVAAHLEPEILIVDEVLAVGDAEFQKKCLGKMQEVASGQGRTVLFVSHNMVAVQSLCPRVVVLRGGSVLGCGTTPEMIALYVSGGGVPAANLATRSDREGDGALRFSLLRVGHQGVPEAEILHCGSEVVFELHYVPQHTIRRVVFFLGIYDNFGTQLLHLNTKVTGCHIEQLDGPGCARCSVPRLPLPPGVYFLTVAAMDGGGRVLDRVERAARLTIEGADFYRSGDISSANWGRFLVDHTWTLESPGSRSAP